MHLTAIAFRLTFHFERPDLALQLRHPVPLFQPLGFQLHNERSHEI